MSLGADALRLNTNIDATVYQARIVGATDGVNTDGWFNLTNAPRSSGWHHARIVIGAPNGADTPASFYIDNMITPLLTTPRSMPMGLTCWKSMPTSATRADTLTIWPFRTT